VTTFTLIYCPGIDVLWMIQTVFNVPTPAARCSSEQSNQTAPVLGRLVRESKHRLQHWVDNLTSRHCADWFDLCCRFNATLSWTDHMNTLTLRNRDAGGLIGWYPWSLMTCRAWRKKTGTVVSNLAFHGRRGGAIDYGLVHQVHLYRCVLKRCEGW
jgi:hypothetical protein